MRLLFLYRTKIISLCTLLFICSSIYGQPIFDTIYFKDGSVVVGKIKKVKLGVVTFDPANTNDINVQLRLLRTIAAVRTVFRIETITGNVYYGNMLPQPDTNYVTVFHEKGSVTLYLQDITVMYPSGNSFLQRFTGNLGLGYNYTRSSNFGRLNFDATVTYTYLKEQVTFYGSGIYTITDSSFSRDNEKVNLKFNHYFTPTWFGTLFLQYQRNLELGLERRYQEGFGIGNKFITTKYVYAWVRSGIVFNQERSSENVNSGTLTELFAQLDFNFFRFTKPKVDLAMAQTIYYNTAQSRLRNDGNTKVNWEAVKNFKLSLEFYNNYDSKPPVEGSSNLDYGILFGVSYFFY